MIILLVRTVYEHLMGFQFASAGAMTLICDMQVSYLLTYILSFLSGPSKSKIRTYISFMLHTDSMFSMNRCAFIQSAASIDARGISAKGTLMHVESLQNKHCYEWNPCKKKH